MKFLIRSLLTFSIAFFLACQSSENLADAYGYLEANSLIISAESNGQLLFLNVEEGQQLEVGKLIGLVDTTELHLQRQQLKAVLNSVTKKMKDNAPEIAILETQRQGLLDTRELMKLWYAEIMDDPPRPWYEINNEIKVVEQKIKSTAKQANIANRSVLAEQDPIQAQIDLLDARIEKCYLKSPITGKVLNRLAEPFELVRFGMPLIKMANLDYLTLKAFVSGDQLSDIQVGNDVQVLVGNVEAEKTLNGTINWIAEEAEFTPRNIQTRQELVDLVYGMKIKVKNDGHLKIGMPAEVIF